VALKRKKQPRAIPLAPSRLSGDATAVPRNLFIMRREAGSSGLEKTMHRCHINRADEAA
jgi:hypothetical protein